MIRINFRMFRTYMILCRLLDRKPYTVSDLRTFAADPERWLREGVHND